MIRLLIVVANLPAGRWSNHKDGRLKCRLMMALRNSVVPFAHDGKNKKTFAKKNSTTRAELFYSSDRKYKKCVSSQ